MQLKNLSYFHEHLFESIAVKVNISDKKSIIIVSLYRPPLTNREHKTFFLDKFKELLSQLKALKIPFLIMTDSNLNLMHIENDSFVEDYLTCMQDYDAVQLINKVTRISGNSKSAIDHIISNLKPFEINATGVINDSISDHYPTFIFLNECKNGQLNETKIQRCFSQENKQKFTTNLNSIQWTETLQLEDPNEAAINFSNLFNDLFELHFPKREMKFNLKKNAQNAFMTKGLLISRGTKMKLDRKAKLRPSLVNINKARTYRNIYNLLIKKAKKLYFEKKIENAGNCPKKVWKTLNEISRGARSKEKIDSVFDGENTIYDTVNIANSFNTHFSKIGSNVKEQIPETEIDFREYLPPRTLQSIFLNPTTPHKIEKKHKWIPKQKFN